MSEAEHGRAGFVGYAALIGLTLAGGGGGLVLLWLGLASYFSAADRPVKTAGQGHELVGSLEGALILWSFGILGVLVAVISIVVLLKGLSDDVASARRGPV